MTAIHTDTASPLTLPRFVQSPEAEERTPLIDDIMDAVGDRYLLMIRENYLEDDRADQLVTLLANIVHRLVSSRSLLPIIALAQSRNWRESVVGLHLGIVAASGASTRAGRMEEHFRERMLTRIIEHYRRVHEHDRAAFFPLCARPALMLDALTLNSATTRKILRSITLHEDGLDVYSAALAVDALIHERTTGLAKSFREHLTQQKWFDPDSFTQLSSRFERAYRFWGGRHQKRVKILESQSRVRVPA
jgi:hypothetical protein